MIQCVRLGNYYSELLGLSPLSLESSIKFFIAFILRHGKHRVPMPGTDDVSMPASKIHNPVCCLASNEDDEDDDDEDDGGDLSQLYKLPPPLRGRR